MHKFLNFSKNKLKNYTQYSKFEFVICILNTLKAVLFKVESNREKNEI